MEKEEKTSNKIVQTYAEDMAKVIEDDQGGLIKKIIHGEEEHEKEKINLSPESRKNKIFMLLSFLLILISLGTILALNLLKDNSTITIEKQFVPLIFNDKSTFIEVKDLKKDDIASTVLNEVQKTEVKSGGVEGIYPTEDKQIIGLRRFITLTKSNLVPVSTDFLDDNFLMGVVNAETKDFFILMKVRSLSDIFESLRAWENKMFFDLHGFFGVALSPDTNYLLTKDFQDGVMENKNARILYDKDGAIVIMYIFADDNSVIITDTANAAREIMLRLASGKIKK